MDIEFRNWRWLSLCLCLSFPFLAQSQSAIGTNTFEIARTWESSASFDGVFSSFLEPSINSLGTVVFNARLADTSEGNLNNSGIYRFRVPGGVGPSIVSLEEVVREGETITASGDEYGIADVFLTSFRLEDAPLPNVPVTGLFNKLALRLPVTSGNSDGNSILAIEQAPVTMSGATINLVVAAGAEVPDGNGTFREIGVSNISDITPGADLVFFSALDDTDNGSADNTAIFRYNANGSVTEIVRKGDTTVGGNFQSLATIRTNDSGDLIFLGQNDSGNAGTDSAIYRVAGTGTSAATIVSEGDDAPSDDPEQRVFYQLSEIRINNNDLVGFAAVMRDENGFAISNDSGLYTASGLSVTEIVREGQLTPDGDMTFGNFASTFTGDVPRSPFNDLGQFAFTVDLIPAGGGQPSSGVFRASASELIKIAQEGDGYEDGTFLNFDDPALNNQGLVAFVADLNLGFESGEEGPFPINDDILILTDGSDYATVARSGEQVNGRTIDEIFFNNVATGIANGLSDSGIVAYEVRYEDGTSAINVWRPQLGWRSAAGDGIWEDESNWFFNMMPNFASDVNIDGNTDIEVQGPVADTALNSLSFGNGGGQVSLLVGGATVTTAEGIAIGENGTLRVGQNQTFSSDGDLLNNGTIALDPNSGLIIEGRFSGDGPINGASGMTTFAGELSPGNSPGLLEIAGDAALTESTETVLELAGLARGDEFDAIDVDGTFTLDGTLNIVLLGDFEPVAGDTFLLIQAGNLLGDFIGVNLPEIAGLQWFFDRDSQSLSLNVQPVPLPPAAWLLLSALVVLGSRRRMS